MLFLLMQKKMDKKGQIFDLTKEWIVWIVKAIVFFVVASMIIIIVNIPLSSEFKTDGLRHSLLRQHLIYDENCLAYNNERTYPGIVDINKFTLANLEKCFSTQNYGAQLILSTDKSSIIKLNEKLNKFEFCFDKKNFYCSNTTYYVLVKENDIEKQGILNIAIL